MPVKDERNPKDQEVVRVYQFPIADVWHLLCSTKAGCSFMGPRWLILSYPILFYIGGLQERFGILDMEYSPSRNGRPDSNYFFLKKT